MIIIEHFNDDDMLKIYHDDTTHIFGFYSKRINELIMRVSEIYTIIGITKNSYYFDGDDKEAVIRLIEDFTFQYGKKIDQSNRDVLKEYLEEYMNEDFHLWLEKFAKIELKKLVKEILEDEPTSEINVESNLSISKA